MGRSTDGHEPDRRRSHVARGLTLLAATALIALPTGMAVAQQLPQPLPEPPSIDGCAADPAGCLPDAPEVDPCLDDPKSCLPEAPAVDECVADPASCLPESPPVDECVADPESCLPEKTEVDRCIDDPHSCLTEELGGGKDPGKGGDQGKDEDADEVAATPVNGEPPRGSKAGSQTTGREGEAASGPSSTPPSRADLRERPVSRVRTSSGGGLLDRIRRGLTDAAQRFAFPLAVAGLVAAFVLVQGRIDRRDPKLAAAPIHSRHDVVEFR